MLLWCLALTGYGAAMAIFNPIPGQESRNSDYLLESGAAIKINNIATVPTKLNHLLSDGSRLKTLKSNATRIAKPQAAFDVAKIALNWKWEMNCPRRESNPHDLSVNGF